MAISKKRATELKAYVETRVDEACHFVNERADIWKERLAFVRGKQYVATDGMAYSDVGDPAGEEREIHNFIGTFVRSAVANRLKSWPNPEVPAATGDQRSVARADATEKLLKSFVDDEVIAKDEMVRALTWAATVGGAWMKVYWDPEGGKPILEEPALKTKEVIQADGSISIESEEETDEFGEPVVSRTFEGCIKCEFVDTIDGIPDPTAKRFDEMRYWVHRKLRPVSDLERRFPKDFFGAKTDGRFTSAKGPDVNQSDREVIDGDGPWFTSPGSSAKGSELVQLIEYWEPKTPDRPNGMLMVYAGEVLIYVGANPYRPARLPVVLLLGDNIVPSGLYSDGVVEALIPLQRTLNHIESQKKEWIRNLYHPRIFNPMGSGVDSDEFGLLPQIIDHAPGLMPQVMNLPPIPQALFEAPNELVSRMKEISTYSDISRGDVPQGIESGRAIAFLRENEQTIREPDILLHKSACLAMLRHCLWLSKQFYEANRMIKTLGEDGWEYFTFNEDDFDWFTDLAPEAFSGGPSSRALRWAETMEAFSAGLFDDAVPGSKEARRMLELDHSGRSTVDSKRGSRRLARMENMQIEQMAQGAPVQINEVREFHDDQIHLEEHNALRNSTRYLEIPEWAQQAIDLHCEQHEMNLQAKQALSGEDAAAMGPQTGASPPAEQPPGQESPMDGGHSVGEEQPESQDEFMTQH